MNALPHGRRFVVAAVAVGASAALLRSPIAQSVMLRGDEQLYRGRPASALRFYRRALWIDPGDATTIDRLLFVATMMRDRPAVHGAIVEASRYLIHHPSDSTVRMDRAIAYRLVGRKEEALHDFVRVGRDERDVRALAFAGFTALSIGRPRQARAYWRSALALSPGFIVARRALERTKHVR